MQSPHTQDPDRLALGIEPRTFLLLGNNASHLSFLYVSTDVHVGDDEWDGRDPTRNCQ